MPSTLQTARRLSPAQRSLLSALVNADGGDLHIGWRDLRSFRVLERKGYVRWLHGGWGRVTDEGRIVFLTWLANEDVPEARNAQRALAKMVASSRNEVQ